MCVVREGGVSGGVSMQLLSSATTQGVDLAERRARGQGWQLLEHPARSSQGTGSENGRSKALAKSRRR